jgi:hypothetical protein
LHKHKQHIVEIPLELNKLPDLNWVMVFTPATDSSREGPAAGAQSESPLDFMLHQWRALIIYCIPEMTFLCSNA